MSRIPHPDPFRRAQGETIESAERGENEIEGTVVGTPDGGPAYPGLHEFAKVGSTEHAIGAPGMSIRDKCALGLYHYWLSEASGVDPENYLTEVTKQFDLAASLAFLAADRFIAARSK